MNYKERGYLFQDVFSSLIVFKYINRILSGDDINTKVVLDKKSNNNDKFDDLKIIEDTNSIEIQLKHKEQKERLDLKDFSNYSGDFNLYQFIRSYKNGENSNLNLIISLKRISYEDELIKNIEIDSTNVLISSERYKFKDNTEFVDLLYTNRLSTIPKPNIDYSDITKEDIKKFISVFRFEVTNDSFTNGGIIKRTINQISNDMEKISKIPKQVIYNDMLETIREYRAEDTYKEVSIKEITNKWLERLKIMNYTIPVNNDLLVDYNCMVSRKKDVENIIEMFSKTNLIHVYGQPGVGKSWLSRELTDILNKKNIKNSTYYFYFNTNDMDRSKRLTKFNFITTFNHNLQKYHGYNISIFNLNFEDLILEDDNQEHFIIFDGLDHIIREKDSTDIDINELIKEILKFSDNNKNIKIIILSQPIENVKLDYSYELKNLDEKTTNKLIEMYSKEYNFSLKKLKDNNFYLKSSGNPLLLKYMIMDYILNGNIIDSNIKSLNDYYEMIFSGNQISIYLYFAIIKFPITAEELVQISSFSYDEIKKELKRIRNVLLVNEKKEFTIFHESLRKYLLNLKQLNKEKLISDIVNWFKSIDLYTNSKKFNNYPLFIIENKKYDLYDEIFDYNKIKKSIIQNAYSYGEVNDFIKYNFKISQKKADYNSMYYFEYFYDTYTTFTYDFDVNIFENYIYMLYYLGDYNLLRKLVYTKEIPKYSNFDEQWKYIRKILIFLMKNGFDLKYNEIINKFFSKKDADYLMIEDIFLPNNAENYRLISEYLKYKGIKSLRNINTNIEPNTMTYNIINSLIYDRKKIFIEVFYEKGVYITKGKKEELEELLKKIKKEDYISSLNNLYSMINYIFNNNKKEIERIFSDFDDIFHDVPKVYCLICELLKIILENDVDELKLDTFFEKYNYSELCFKGHLTNYENDDFNFIGKLIVENNNRDLIIKKFMKFREKMLNDEFKHFDDGITSTLSAIYYQIIENIKHESTIIENSTLETIIIKKSYQKSNISEFEDNLNNYILTIIAGTPNNFYFDNIIKYMFSYGSYRDIQIWELEDILSRLINTKKIDLNKFISLVVIAYNAIDRMDRAKDVWHIPNELLKTYSEKVSATDALNVFLSMLETFDYDIRDKDDLFHYLYDNINKKESKKLKCIYYYWRFLNTNIEYQFSSNDTELKKYIKNSNKKEYRFIQKNVAESLNNGEFDLNSKLIIKNFKKKKHILKYIEIPSKNVSTNMTNKEKIKYSSFKDLIIDIDTRYINYNNLDYYNLIDIISKEHNNQEIYELFITIDNSSSLYYIYEILEKNNFDYNIVEKNIIVEILVGIYYRSNGYVSNMFYDEIFEKALKISKSTAINCLKKYITSDDHYTLGRKSGKVFKYLIQDNDIDEIFKDIVEIYLSRLPNYRSISRYWNVASFDKNDILLNYFLIKLMNSSKSSNVSATEEMILLRLFEIKKFKNNRIVYMENKDGDSLKYIFEFLKMYHSILRINYQSFLNYKKVKKFDYIRFQMNDKRTEIIIGDKKIINNELNSLLVNNYRGFIIIESNNVFKYNANMYQDFNNGILDRDIKYKIYNIYRVNYYKYLLNVFDSKIKIYLNYKKIKRIIRKSVYFFDNYYVFHLNIPKK